MGLVGRTCGTTAGWQKKIGATYLYYGRTYPIDCAATAVRPAQQQASRAATRSSSRVDAVIGYARAQLGDPYRWAKAGPNGFDCSGLVLASYRQVGVNLPHQSRAMLAHGRKVTKADLRAGDVVWLMVQRGSKGHVGIYLGGGQVIEAARGGVQVRALGNRYWTARRLL